MDLQCIKTERKIKVICKKFLATCLKKSNLGTHFFSNVLLTSILHIQFMSFHNASRTVLISYINLYLIIRLVKYTLNYKNVSSKYFLKI